MKQMKSDDEGSLISSTHVSIRFFLKSNFEIFALRRREMWLTGKIDLSYVQIDHI